MEIVQTPNNILTQQAKPIEHINDKITTLIEGMKVALKTSKIGVGLAAPQVGVSLQMFITAPTLIKRLAIPESNPYKIFINPKVLSAASGRKLQTGKRPPKTTLEGCLSIPNVWGHVARSPRIKLVYLDETGASHTDTFTGFMATILQHEMDHLIGTLFTHHVIAQGRKLYHQVKNGETGKMVMKEIKL